MSDKKYAIYDYIVAKVRHVVMAVNKKDAIRIYAKHSDVIQSLDYLLCDKCKKHVRPEDMLYGYDSIEGDVEVKRVRTAKKLKKTR